MNRKSGQICGIWLFHCNDILMHNGKKKKTGEKEMKLSESRCSVVGKLLVQGLRELKD